MLAAASGAALVAGCTASSGDKPAGSPDDGVRSAVAASELALIAQYQAAIAAFPDLGASLVAILEQHRAHLAVVAPGEASSQDAAAPTAAAPAATSAGQMVGALAEAERVASQERRQACREAADPELARILAFIAASEASHVPALGQVPT